jgi:hypothetical protein
MHNCQAGQHLALASRNQIHQVLRWALLAPVFDICSLWLQGASALLHDGDPNSS